MPHGYDKGNISIVIRDEDNQQEPMTSQFLEFSQVCPANQFRCNDGFCIKESSECDNSNDCYYGEGELYCTEEECPQKEFRCNDGSCILHYFLCDDFDGCENGEDEEDCNEECPYNKYECSDGYCISTFWLCDDYEDCENGEDQEECTKGLSIKDLI
ncbi:LRP4 [Mytilus coruscus]|uniref:LRP4 n=1 Tax=Mytilus coruscus TaxID=42192 RepID=A0A6J8CLJ5_MYTCO|nr:LRP4 [Mytilus coruscus]